MHVAVRVNNPQIDECISVREIYTHESQKHRTQAGTVLLTNVSVASNIRGRVMEIQSKRIRPKKDIAMWPKMRYVASVGGYVDIITGQMVDKAKAVYMHGPTIHYLPS